MKFISKSSNYMLVLKPGIQGNHLTGQASVPGVYVRFRDGIAEIKDSAMVDLMKVSEGYRMGDFVAVDDNGEDPFSDNRTAIEPDHIISEIKYGHVEGRKVSATQKKLPTAVKKLIEAEASKLARQMLPGLMKEALKEMQAEMASTKTVHSPEKVSADE